MVRFNVVQAQQLPESAVICFKFVCICLCSTYMLVTFFKKSVYLFKGLLILHDVCVSTACE
jgi:hypothetical protein